MFARTYAGGPKYAYTGSRLASLRSFFHWKPEKERGFEDHSGDFFSVLPSSESDLVQSVPDCAAFDDAQRGMVLMCMHVHVFARAARLAIHMSVPMSMHMSHMSPHASITCTCLYAERSR